MENTTNTQELTADYKALDRILEDWAGNEYAETTGTGVDEAHGMFIPTMAMDVEFDTDAIGQVIEARWKITDSYGNVFAEDSAQNQDGIVADVEARDDDRQWTVQKIVDDYLGPAWHDSKLAIEDTDYDEVGNIIEK
ncbi:hypothetical protein BAAM0499_05920 [Bifidobacterium animalis subsp. animalis MCC 0499]|uniref:hypothetical protein n=1 Tax=Bifidobacterium animalis TaxID=28025 RepID=UPI00069CB473|nr:hypothetical protein [Bifidobacterium animalis]KOA61155.1 hypothetical protein BAAM0499_05920 [Bifidobacterium animalis subsp. animalis MCC 0499]